MRAISGHHQRLGARRQICVRRINQNIAQHRTNNRATWFTSHDRVESRRQSFDVGAFSATLEPFKRDVFTQTHASTLEGGCYLVLLLLAPADLAGFFAALGLGFVLGLAFAFSAVAFFGFAARLAGFLPPFDAV